MYPSFLSDVNETWIFVDKFFKNTQLSYFIKIGPVGTELFHADRRTGMMKLMVILHNSASAPKRQCLWKNAASVKTVTKKVEVEYSTMQGS
jgi:hypothetical protein